MALMTKAELLCWVAAGLAAVSMGPTVVALLADGRTIGGQSVWAKPLKFEASLALHLATLALAAAALPPGRRGGWLVALTLGMSVVVALGELAYITIQAARQEASHFNLTTSFHRLMYSLMGIGAVILVLGAALLGMLIAWEPAPGTSAALRWAWALGLGLGAVLTLVVAGSIGARLSPFVGAEAAAGPRMAVTGWALTGGDLRIAHFFATHMMQALPLAGLVLAWCAPPVVATAAVVGLAGAWTATTLLLFARALAGAPPWP